MNEILVTPDFGRGRPAIVGFDSEFFVIWPAVGNQDLKGARIDLFGTKQDEFTINTTVGNTGLPAISRIPRGFVAVWFSSPPTKLLFQRFGDDGRKQGPEIVVSDTNIITELDRIRAPSVAMLTSGNFVISWVAAVPENQVRAAIFNPFDGGRVGGEIAVNTSAGTHFFPAIAAFRGLGSDDIAFAIAWTGGEDGIFRSRFQMFDENGTKIGGEVLTRKAVGAVAPVIFSQNDLREFIGFIGDGSQARTLTTDLFIRDGSSLGDNITHASDNTINFDLQIQALPEGTAVMTWTQGSATTNSGNNVVAGLVQVMRSNPDFPQHVPGGVAVNTSSAGGQSSISASPMVESSGAYRIAFTWTDGPAIKARIMSGDLRA